MGALLPALSPVYIRNANMPYCVSMLDTLGSEKKVASASITISSNV
jgi:hypothetical protein